MHVLIIPSWYLTPDNPIRGSFFREQGLALQNAGHKVGFLVPPTKLRSRHGIREFMQNWRQSPLSLQLSDDQGMPTYRIPWWGMLGSFFPWSRANLVQDVFERYCADNGKPDVLHGHSILYGGYLAAYLGKRHNIPSVLTEHSSNYLRSRILFPQQWFVRYTMNYLDAAFAVSPRLASAIKEYNPGKVVKVLPNMVDTNRFHPPKEEPPLLPFRFVAIGSLYKLKGHHILLEAFARSFRNKDVTLQIAGEGPARHQLEQMIRQLGIDSQVVLRGALSRNQVRDLLQESHALVSASFSENHPVSMLEALSCGRPIVATRCNGPEYFVDETMGILVEVGDIAGLAEAMRAMHARYTDYDRQAIRQDCIRRFSEEAIIAELESVYHDLIGGAAHS